MYFRIVDEIERRGFELYEEDGELILSSLVLNSTNFIPLEDVEANAEDAMQQFKEQREADVQLQVSSEQEGLHGGQSGDSSTI